MLGLFTPNSDSLNMATMLELSTVMMPHVFCAFGWSLCGLQWVGAP